MKTKINKKIIFPILLILVLVILSLIVGIAINSTKDNKEYTAETAKEDFTYTVLGESIIIDSYIGKKADVVVPAKIDGIIVNAIGPNAFFNSDVESVTLPVTLTTINMSAFSNCKNLKKIELPDNLEILGAFAFSECEKLEKISIPEKISIIRVSTFEGCSALQTVKFSDEITEIGENAFRGTAIKNISLPEKVSIIRPYAFAECDSLTKVKIPDSLISITDTTFDYQNITFEINNNEKITEFINKIKE